MNKVIHKLYSQFIPIRNEANGLDKIFKSFVKNNKLIFIFMVLGLSTSVAITIPIPLLTRYIIDDVLVNKDLRSLIPIAVCFVLVIVVQLLVGRLNAWLTSSFSQRFINQTRCNVVQNSLKHPRPGGYDEGNLMVVVNSDVPNLSQLDMTIISTIINSLVSIIAYSIMLFVLNSILAVLALAIMPLYVLWIWHIGKRMEMLNREMQLMNEELLSSTRNIATNHETIISYGFGKQIIDSFATLARKIGSFNKGVAMYTNFAGTISIAITSIACFIPLIVGSYYVVMGEMTIGTLVVFNAYCSMLISPLSSLVNLITKHRLRQVHVERVEQYIGIEVDDNTQGTATTVNNEGDDGIELCNYNLFSGSRKLIAIDYLNICKGSTVLLKGGNGIGKTLLLKSIAGLYACYEGEILVDDLVLPKNTMLAPCRGIKYVSSSQPFVLDSIEAELGANRAVSMNKYQSLMQDLGIDSILANLPQGIKTRNTNLPDSINAGSMQRLRIMRALVQNPQYLLLDEVLSNIDSTHCIQILNIIKKNFPEITIVIVEHHLDLIGQIDAVYRLHQNGVAAE